MGKGLIQADRKKMFLLCFVFWFCFHDFVTLFSPDVRGSSKAAGKLQAQLQQVEAALSGNGESNLLKLKKDLQVALGQYIIASLAERRKSILWLISGLLPRIYGYPQYLWRSVSPSHPLCVHVCTHRGILGF